MPTRPGARAPTSPSSSTRMRATAGRGRGWCTGSSGGSRPRRRSTSGRGGAGTAHPVAWAPAPDDHGPWHQRVARAGMRPTPVIDRFYFKSIYFREPSGVLFEIATIGPGFATDEPLEHLGERLSLPPDFEHLRAQVEPILTPLPNPRETAAAR